jgi:phage repressor protein C with HTH and peptisase S24 domain
MADTTKKAKTTAKPRAAATKTATKKAKAVISSKPTHEQIAHLAKSYWEARGRLDGFAEQDWLRAEKELLQAASAQKAS